MLTKIRGFFKKNISDPKEVDPFLVSSLCMEDISSDLMRHFSSEAYRWNEKAGVKTLECLILSKFLMDQALLTTFHKKIEEIRIEFYLKMHDSILEGILHSTFPNLEASDIVKNRLALYSNIISDNLDPGCWHLIAGTCTGIDYYSQQDLATLVSSSSALPTLLMHAQDSLKLVIRE